MIGHRFSLFAFLLLVVPSPPGASGTPDAPVDTGDVEQCPAIADSILRFDGDPGAEAVWTGPDSRRTVRRLTDAVTPGSAGYDPGCALSAAETTAKEAVDEEPESVDRHYALAVVLGLRADREGGRAKVRAASALYDQLQAILAMDPEHVGAHHLMGRLQAGVMRMGRATRWIATHLLGGGILKKASWAAAEENLAFAAAAAPDVPDYTYELARLHEDTGRTSLALKEARRVLTMDPSLAMEPTVHDKAAALVARLEDKSAS